MSQRKFDCIRMLNLLTLLRIVGGCACMVGGMEAAQLLGEPYACPYIMYVR